MAWTLNESRLLGVEDVPIWGPIVLSEEALNDQDKLLNLADLSLVGGPGGSQVWKLLWVRIEYTAVDALSERIPGWEILDSDNDIVFGAEGNPDFNLGVASTEVGQWGRYGSQLTGQTPAAAGPHEFSLPEIYLGINWDMRFFATAPQAADDMLVHVGLMRDNRRHL